MERQRVEEDVALGEAPRVTDEPLLYADVLVRETAPLGLPVVPLV